MLDDEVLAGIVSCPNVQCECNFVPLATLSLFVAEPHRYNPGAAARAAVQHWAARFGAPTTVEDVSVRRPLRPFRRPF